MVDRVIDLRKKANPAEWEERAPSLPAIPDRVREDTVRIEWSAHEYEPKERSRGWFFFWGGIVLLFDLFGIVAKSYFFIMFVVRAFGVFVMYERKGSRETSFSVTSDGVAVGRVFYKFSDLKSFWMFENEGEKDLSLETKKTLSPFVRLPLRGVDGERIKNFLKNFIPEEEQQEFITDKITRSL